MVPAFALLALAALLPGGCGTIEKDKRALSLQATTNAYQSALCWGYYETAYGFLDPELRKGKALPPMFQDLRVTGYDVVQPPLIQAEGEATQIVHIDYIHEDRQVVERVTDRQRWRWDPASRTWWLRSGMPGFQ